MKRSVLIVVLLLALGAFAAANWAAFNAPTVLTLGVVDFTAPLGLLLLLTFAVIGVVALASFALWQGSTLAMFRRNARELETQRQLAEEAEASRFTALTTTVEQERTRVEARVEASEAALRAEINDGINSLAAMLAELDNRLHGDERSTVRPEEASREFQH